MWKTCCGRCIYHSPQGIEVYDNLLFRWLKFNSNPLQTLLNKALPQRPALYYIKPLTSFIQMKPSTCLMLGLGGGGVAHALRPARQLVLTVIESNQEVIELAQRFFKIQDLTQMTVIHQDALDFITQTNQQFNHLLVDLSDPQAFPSHCKTPDFFYHCQRVLQPQGILAINLANPSEHWPIFQLIRAVFGPATLVMPVKKSANIIIFAIKEANVAPFLLFKEGKSCKKLYWDSRWGCIGGP